MKMRNQICNESISVEIVMEILNMHSTILHSMDLGSRARSLHIKFCFDEYFVLENILSLRKYSSILAKNITEGLIWCGAQVFRWKMSAIYIIDDNVNTVCANNFWEMRSVQTELFIRDFQIII